MLKLVTLEIPKIQFSQDIDLKNKGLKLFKTIILLKSAEINNSNRKPNDAIFVLVFQLNMLFICQSPTNILLKFDFRYIGCPIAQNLKICSEFHGCFL